MSNIERWIEKFRGFGAQPSPDRYVALFDSEGTVFDSGMERPLGVSEIPLHLAGILKLMPDLHISVRRWRARADTVFVEALNSATIAGQKAHWEAVYCVTLRGDRVLRGRRYYDRAPLLALVRPTLPKLLAYEPIIDPTLAHTSDTQTYEPRFTPTDFLERYTRLWQEPTPQRFADFYHPLGRMLNPGMERPLRKAEIPGYYAFLLSSAPDLHLERLAWAGDQHVLYVEWHGSGTFVGKPFQIDVVDCFEFLEDRVIFGQAYFDTIVLLGLLDPAISSLHFIPSAGVASETSRSKTQDEGERIWE